MRDVPWYSALGLAAVVTFEIDTVEEMTKEGNARNEGATVPTRSGFRDGGATRLTVMRWMTYEYKNNIDKNKNNAPLGA